MTTCPAVCLLPSGGPKSLKAALRKKSCLPVEEFNVGAYLNSSGRLLQEPGRYITKNSLPVCADGFSLQNYSSAVCGNDQNFLFPVLFLLPLCDSNDSVKYLSTISPGLKVHIMKEKRKYIKERQRSSTELLPLLHSLTQPCAKIQVANNVLLSIF